MRFDRDHLTFKALCALDQAANECAAAPLRQTFALRFALAYLYAVGSGDKAHFDEFWRVIADPMDRAYSPSMASYMRSTNARTALNGIARGVGYPNTPEAWARLTVWRDGGGK